MLYITDTEGYNAIRTMKDLRNMLEQQNKDLKEWIAKGPPAVGPRGAELMEEKISQNQEYMTKLLHYIGLMEQNQIAAKLASPRVPVPKSWLRGLLKLLNKEVEDLFVRIYGKGHIMGHATDDLEVRGWIERVHNIQNFGENIGDYLEL